MLKGRKNKLFTYKFYFKIHTRFISEDIYLMSIRRYHALKIRMHLILQ